MSASTTEQAERRNSADMRTNAWLIPIIGVGVALLVALLIDLLFFQPTIDQLTPMFLQLGFYAWLSVIIGFILYRLGWAYSPSLTFAVSFTLILVGVLTLVNGGVAAWLMFADPTSLTVVGILLVFSTMIGTAFAVYGFSRTTRSLRELATVAQQVADGDLSARAHVPGRDEVAQLGKAFNEMAAKLEQAEVERQELEQLRNDLIAWVSHDLRTPLTSIRAMVEALADGIVTDDAMIHRYYQTIRADVLGLTALINDQFELAQLGARGIKIEKVLVSLGDLISDTIESVRVLAEQRDIELVGEIGDDLDAVMISPQGIGRVLTNLIGNALRYTPDSGTIVVSAQRIGDEVAVAVTDSGPGFAEADLPRLFEKFYRGEEARTRAQGSGAGLGLAIAKGIVEAHGGEISAENVPDGGACVRFVLPAS
ncbi:MAG: HAMP domain-containing histidine kinase [Anaerolineae bacterium]|nr:HAMP domain-containing histidine kinase [Anaerolineae bacterium]